MSCWHLTVALRIPASALGFKYLREWKEFLRKHEDDFAGKRDASAIQCVMTILDAWAGEHWNLLILTGSWISGIPGTLKSFRDLSSIIISGMIIRSHPTTTVMGRMTTLSNWMNSIRKNTCPNIRSCSRSLQWKRWMLCACVILSGTTEAGHHIFIHTGMKNES